jgi:hypothetical protein
MAAYAAHVGDENGFEVLADSSIVSVAHDCLHQF